MDVEKLEMQGAEAKSENFDETPFAKDDFDWNSYIDSFNSTSSSPPSMSKADLDDLPNYENIKRKIM